MQRKVHDLTNEIHKKKYFSNFVKDRSQNERKVKKNEPKTPKVVKKKNLFIL